MHVFEASYIIENWAIINKASPILLLWVISPTATSSTANENPIFLFENLKIKNVKIIKNKHIFNLFISNNGKTVSAISFNSVDNPIGKYLLNYKKQLNVIGYLKENFWNNKKTLQLVVLDLIL